MKTKKNIGPTAILATAAWLILCFSATESFGGTLVKSFDFGPGGDNPTARSHSRTFLVPEAVAVAVRINYRTASETPVALIVEIEDAAGRNLTTREIPAEKTARQMTINFAAGQNTMPACEKGWNVRIKTRDGEAPKTRINGDITLSFIDPAAAPVAIEGPVFSLRKGAQASRAIGTTETFRHPGLISIRASWTHNPLAQATPLKFELVRPDGSTAKTLVGYGINSNARPKLDFEYRVVGADTKQSGLWRLRITNASDQEISEINPSATYTRRCFE